MLPSGMVMSLQQWPDIVRRARDLVMQHGWNATSYQIVNPGIRHWFSANGDAVVGFVPYAGIRVIAGAPVCDPSRLADVVGEFETDARRSKEGVVYFGSEARLERTLPDSPSHSRALLGAQPAWNPADWEGLLQSHASLRAQLRRAMHKGVTIEEISPDEAAQSPELRAVLEQWLRGRGLPPLHFLVEPDTLQRLDDRRTFVARLDTIQGSPVIAFAVLSPIPARKGFLVEQFPRLPDAPNGTIELLLSSAVRSIAKSGATYVSLGLAPLARRSQFDTAHEPRWLASLLSFAASHGRRFYNFQGLEAFKTKFRPQVWEPVYAIEAGHRFTPRALYAIAGAFASRSPLGLIAEAAGNAIRERREAIKS